MVRLLGFVLALMAGLACAVPAAWAQPAPRVEASLVAEQMALVPGGTVTIALREIIAPGWHVYWVNPGDSGEPTQINWKLPEGFSAGALQWPAPERIAVDPLVNYGFAGELLLLSDIRVPPDLKPGTMATLAADVTWLACADTCVPESASLRLDLPVSAGPSEANAGVAALFARARSGLPQALPKSMRFAVDGKTLNLVLDEPEIARATRKAELFPTEPDIIRHAVEQKLSRGNGALHLKTEPGRLLAPAEGKTPRDAFDAVLVLTDKAGTRSAFAVSAEVGAVESPSAGIGLPVALVFALLGGIILNLMPCVFPILSMKALALAEHSSRPASEARAHGLAYGAGVIASCLAIAGVLLALRAAGEAVGWGFQLQQPIIVGGLSLLFLAIALNLAGVFEISLLQSAGAGAQTQGLAGAALTGALVVLVASPCTAPFMAAALGFALVAPAYVALAIFAALGVGMALPFMILSASPGIIRRLPRPGAWMARFKTFLAFPMLAAAAWLLWVVSAQAGSQGLALLLAAALALSLGAWMFGLAQRGAKNWVRAAAALCLVAVVACMVPLRAADAARSEASEAKSGPASEPYTALRLAALREAGRPVFVNLTADWCITCKANEALALSLPGVRDALAKHNVAYLVGDWTRRNPEITVLLEDYGRSGVPLYLFFAPGAEHAKVLPQLLTQDIVISSISIATAETGRVGGEGL